MAKRNVAFIKQDEPAFIKNFKSKVGYKESDGINAKSEYEFPDGHSDEEETAEDKPTVVVLKKGDLTAEEAEQIKNTLDNDKSVDSSGRILFKKPVKRSSDDKDAVNVTSSTKTVKASEDSLTDPKKARTSKATNDRKLLSFDQDDEDENT